MKSDEEKLRELFEMREKPTFNNTIKRAKISSVLRTITISLMIFIIVSFIVLALNSTLLSYMSNNEEDNLRTWYNVAMPNAYMGNTQVDDRVMVGHFEYTQYRFLGEKPVVDGVFNEDYSYMPLINGIYGDRSRYLFNSTGRDSKDLEEVRKYNKVGKQVMKFYHPSIEYEKYINDLDDLKEISNDKLLEISLSFDKAYTLDEVKTLIPEGVTLNWYWVDTLEKDSKGSLYKSILEEYDVYGIKALDSQGNQIKNPEIEFINAIIMDRGKNDNGKVYENLFTALSDEQGHISRESLRIVGVVVSGDVEVLKALKDKNYIKAATIGAVADKY